MIRNGTDGDAHQGALERWLKELGPSRSVPFLEVAAWALGGFYAVSAVAHAGGPLSRAPAVVVASAVSAFLLAGVALTAARARDDRVRTGLAWGVGGIVMANAVFRVLLVGTPEQTTHLGLALVALGAFFPIRVYTIATVAGWLAWLLTVASSGASGTWGHYGEFLVTATGLGFVFLFVRHYRDGEMERARRIEEGLSRDVEVSLGWYKKLFHESPALMCLHDEVGRVEEVNPAGLKALGYSRQEVVGRNIMDFMVPVTLEGPESYLREVQEKGGAEGLLRVRRADGSLRIWEYRSTNLDTGGESQILATAADVTELARARDWVGAHEDPPVQR
ncbi:MAG: PAS domain S-box protein [Gemmatimonadota bacterium]